MTADEIRAWAARSGWHTMGGYLSLTKSSSPEESIVRLVLRATVAHVEAKKPAGKWEKLTDESYAQIATDPESGMPLGLGLETIPGFSILMQDNRDRQVFVK